MSYKKFSATEKHFKEINKTVNEIIVQEGYDAYEAGVSPDHSPYINLDGDNRNAFADWLCGWSRAYREDSWR